MARKRGGDGHGGGGGGHDGAGALRWLLTYADMITLLMVFFIVLYSMSQVDSAKYQELQRSLQVALSSGSIIQFQEQPIHTNTPGPGKAPSATGEGLGNTKEDPLELLGRDVATALNELVKAGEIRVSTTERGTVISMQGSVLYALGDAEIRPGAEPVLHEVAQALARVPNSVVVEGYTDDYPINTPQFPSNWELSTRRATNVVRFLIEREGLAPQRFSAAGYGEYRPLFPNNSDANRAKNRRVDIVILKTDPGLNVGKELAPKR